MPSTSKDNNVVKKGMWSQADLVRTLGFNGLGVGNVYYVIQTTNDDYTAFVRDHQGVYADGTSVVYGDIQAALDACTGERNDYVLVMPDAADYDVGATLTMSKASVHLICPAGLGAEYGCATRAATIDPNSAAHAITITGRGCEVAGFWIRGYTEKGCITSSGVGVWIHHNDCAVTCTTSAAFGITISSAGLGSKVERNFIFSNAGSGTWTHGISLAPQATRSHAVGNVIMVSNASTLTNGIDTTAVNTVLSGAMILVKDNVISEQPAVTGTGAATLSCGIRSGDGVIAVANKVAMATVANGFIGGTADKTLVDNFQSASGGTLGV